MYELLERTSWATGALLAVFGALTVAESLLLAMVFGRPLGEAAVAIAVVAVVFICGYLFGDRGILGTLRGRVPEHPLRAKAKRVMEEASLCMGVAAPGLVLLEGSALNAAALGREIGRRLIITTTATVETLDDDALRAVFAHELAHIRSGDTSLYPVMVVAVEVARLIFGVAFCIALAFVVWPGLYLVLAIVLRDPSIESPFALLALALTGVPLARLTQVAFMRTREYSADAAAALGTRDPMGLARALVAMDARLNSIDGAGTATSHMYAMPPESLWQRPFFEVHPPVAERLERLWLANPSDHDLAQLVGDYFEKRALRPPVSSGLLP